MSVISQALDQTQQNIKKHKRNKSKTSDIDGNRVETDGNDPDLDALEHLMEKKRRQNKDDDKNEFRSTHNEAQRQAIGTSMDIFDSSYGSMPYRQFKHGPTQSKDFNQQYDCSVSLVQQEESYDDKMLFKNNLANSKKKMDEMLDPVIENENIPTDAPSDLDNDQINTSNAVNHYMNTSFGVKPQSPTEQRPNSSQTDPGTQPLMPGDISAGLGEKKKKGKQPQMSE